MASKMASMMVSNMATTFLLNTTYARAHIFVYKVKFPRCFIQLTPRRPSRVTRTCIYFMFDSNLTLSRSTLPERTRTVGTKRDSSYSSAPSEVSVHKQLPWSAITWAFRSLVTPATPPRRTGATPGRSLPATITGGCD